MFDKCVLFNLHVSKPMCSECVSSLYYIIQNRFLCSTIQNVYTFANKIYIHTYYVFIYYYYYPALDALNISFY